MVKQTHRLQSIVLALALGGVYTVAGAQPPAPAPAPSAAEVPPCCHAGHPAPVGPRAWQRADANADGTLTRAELEGFERTQRERRAQHFAAADRDHDGRLTAAEMRAYHRAARASGRGAVPTQP